MHPDWLPVLLSGLGLGAVALVAVHVLLYNTYWDYSEGVYALSAHLMLHGDGLYTSIVGAQPPGVFLVGVVLLAVHDTLEWLRFGVACLQLVAGLIAGQIVLRITANRLASVLTTAGTLLTPWAVHEHGALTPELVALPLLMGAALLSADERHARVTGVLCGLLPMIKVPFVIPALVLVTLSADPRRSARWGLATLVLALASTTLVAGGSFWRDVFVAQTQTGYRSLGVLKGFWAQAGWNVLGLLVCAALAVRYFGLARDKRILRTTLGLAVALIVTLMTNFKQGTGLNITVPVEAALVPLAACGTVFAFRAARSPWVPIICCCALAFTLAQSISLIASPRHSVPFLRAGSRPAWGVAMTASQLRAAVATARTCPSGVPYSGPPLIAFVAGRQMPAGQPDQFIVPRASALASVRAKVAAVKHVCP